MRCCVPFCRNGSDNVTTSEAQAIAFHRFPSEVNLCAAWLKALGKQDPHLPDTAVVCSQHFLSDDMYETEDGIRQICTGAVPSTVQVCMICLDTDNKLLLMSKHKLQEVYEKFTGVSVCEGNLKPTLCVQCAQRLVNCSRFRDKCLRTHSLMTDLVEKCDLITLQHIQKISPDKNKLESNFVSTMLGPDHCNLRIVEDTDEDKQLKETVNREFETAILTNEESDESISVYEYLEVINEDDNHGDTIDDDLCKAVQRRAGVSSDVAASFSCDLVMTKNEKTVHKPKSDQQLTTDMAHTSVSPRLATDSETKVLTTEEDNQPLYNSNSAEKPYSCELCDYKCTRKSFLVLHMRTHTGENLLCCELCDYKFPRKWHLMMHMRTHTGEKPHACHLCDYKCARKYDLMIHVRTHTGEKPFHCKLCGYKSTQRSDLKVHMRIHTGEKPYSCELCEYKCKRKCHLTIHMRCHTGEKPYACRYCQYKCTHKTNLMRHMKAHTDKDFDMSCLGE